MLDIYIYIYIKFQMLMSASTTLVIQTPHAIILLDPSSVPVRKDLLDMVVIAQVWNANVRMEGDLPIFSQSPSSSFLLLLLLFPLIPQYCFTQFPTFKPTSTSLTPFPIFTTTTTPNYILLLVLLLLLFGTQIVLLVQYFLELRFFFSKGIFIVPLIRNSNY